MVVYPENLKTENLRGHQKLYLSLLYFLIRAVNLLLIILLINHVTFW